MDKDFINKEVWVHSDTLLKYANRFTKDENEAEDLLQNTLLKVLRYQESYSKGSNILGWIYTIMRSCFLNDCRKKKLAENYKNSSLSINDPNMKSAENRGENRFAMEDLDAAMETIPEKYLSAFIMHFEGYKYYEIAEHFNVPEGTVKTRIHTARKLLQKKLSTYRDLKP